MSFQSTSGKLVLGSGINTFSFIAENEKLKIIQNNGVLLEINSPSIFEQLISQYSKLEISEKNILTSLEGVIQYIELEGGFYALITRNGEKYIPINIQDKLKDNQPITINECYAKKDAISIYMWGELIYVISYKLE
jgi:hypothetical protein